MKLHNVFLKYRGADGEPVLQSLSDLFNVGPMVDDETGVELNLVDRSLYDENGDEIESDSFEADEDTSNWTPVFRDEEEAE